MTYTLKRMALSRNEAIMLPKIILALGELWRRTRGMIGRSCFDSTYRQAGKQTQKMASEERTNGCVPFSLVSTFTPLNMLEGKDRKKGGRGLTCKDIATEVLPK